MDTVSRPENPCRALTVPGKVCGHEESVHRDIDVVASRRGSCYDCGVENRVGQYHVYAEATNAD